MMSKYVKLELDGKKYEIQIFEQKFVEVPRVDGSIIYVGTGAYEDITNNLPLELLRPGSLSKLFRLAKAHGYLEYPFGAGFENQTASVVLYCSPWKTIAKGSDELLPFYDPLEFRPCPPKSKPMQSVRYSR